MFCSNYIRHCFERNSMCSHEKVTYNYKIRLERNTGTPLNSCCECPAGKGPNATCKHIAAVMLMLEHLSNKGYILIEKSCTEGLQTFHKPKAQYNGQPLKVDSIAPKRVNTYEMIHDH